MEIHARFYQTLMAVASQCGGPVNHRKIAQKLSIAGSAVELRIRKLADMDLIVLLPALRDETNTNRVKADKVYLKHPDALLCRFPQLKEKLEDPRALPVARIHEKESRQYPQSRFYHYASYSGSSVDLVVQRGAYRFGITILDRMWFTKRNVGILRSTVKEGTLRRGFVLYPTYRAYFVGRDILAVPTPIFLATYDYWTDPANTNTDFRLMTGWINQF